MVIVVTLAFAVSLFWKVDVYAITPGSSQPVGPLITVSGAPHDVTRHSILLTDVYVTQLTVWQWIVAQIHPVNEELLHPSDLTETDVPISELNAQGYLEMYDSQSYAKVAGMRALGYDVPGAHVGATITAVTASAPSFDKFSVADRIVSARGRAVTDACGLAAALHGAVPGQPVTMRVQPAAISNSGSITYSSATTISVQTDPVNQHDALTGCPATPVRTVSLGIGVEDAVHWRFPVDVSIDTANIGGPSAGLAMTLGVIDALSHKSLTGHVRVAATGTIDPSGNVDVVGGVPEKTVAVENAHATLFLVPSAQVGEAQRAASKGLTVVGVSTLAQALAVIEQFGGTAPVRIMGTASGGSTS